MQRRFALAVTALILGIVPAGAESLMKVTCTSNSRVVFVARVAQSRVRETTQAVVADNPGAACIYLGDDPTPGVPDAPPSGLPDALSPALDGATNPPLLSTGNASLDTALKALRGERVGVAPTVPKPQDAGTPQTAGIDYQSVDVASLRPGSAEWTRLSVYKGKQAIDMVAADWKRIVREDPAVFGHLTPGISEHGDYVMLSAGPIAPGDRALTCQAAESEGLDCRFGLTETLDEASLSMDDFLALAGPLEEGGGNSSRRVDTLDLEAAGLAPGSAASDGTCWRSTMAKRLSEALVPAAEERRPSEASPPSKAKAPERPGRRHRRRADRDASLGAR